MSWSSQRRAALPHGCHEQLTDSPAARQIHGVVAIQATGNYILAITGTARIGQEEEFQVAVKVTGCGVPLGSKPGAFGVCPANPAAESWNERPSSRSDLQRA
ncbi:hypothetical protein WJX74_008042 [Apatococcus lobatus]|uniref:Uncharacterized protein n=1 Tax=Apatococcus lobatus TaxID=904363 RepID=A0AAW1QY18_9CHLO